MSLLSCLHNLGRVLGASKHRLAIHCVGGFRSLARVKVRILTSRFIRRVITFVPWFITFSLVNGNELLSNLQPNFIGINENLAGRHIIIVEDIVDTGRTMQRMIETLGTRNPASVHICTLLVKPEKLEVDLNIEYAALEIPNEFIVGYGLDYDQQGRNLRDIYTIVE